MLHAPPAVVRHLDASPAQIVSARFRHVALRRLERASGAAAGDIRTSCYRHAPVWRCSAVALDEVGPRAVYFFRFTGARGRARYAGPAGAHWRMVIPAIRRRYILRGVLVQVTVGQPMCERAGQWPC